MSTDIDPRQIEEARRQINRLAEEIAQLSEAELAPAEYYGEFLQRLMTAIAAPAGAVWIRTPQGNLQLQYQINMRQVGLDRFPNSRQMHDELLRQVAMGGQPRLQPPQSSVGQAEGNQIAPGNPTDYVILLAPIIYDKQVAGIVEIWQDPNRGADAQRGFLQFMARMASLASGYTRNHQLRQMVGQQQVWVQLETFARLVHGSLNPTEVGYHVVNEGRRLVEADRVSVALRQGFRPQVIAISGADVVEKRSNLVQLMRALFEAVIDWGEKLVYSGAKDDALPPKVLKALDAYLAESNSKFLVVMPLPDERETAKKKKARSAIMMESFETSQDLDQKAARLEVVGRHATSALYNAAEYRRIPMRFIWFPLAKIQDGLGGKAQAIVTIIFAALVVLILAMIFMPYPLRMDALGTFQPVKRATLYPPVPGTVKAIAPWLTAGKRITEDHELMQLFDLELRKQINDLRQEINHADNLINTLSKSQDLQDKFEVAKQRINLRAKNEELIELARRTNANLADPGAFYLKSPISGVILTADFKEVLGSPVKPNQPLLRVGQVDPNNPRLADWEVELKIPQKHIGQVLRAFKTRNPDEELDVDLLLKTRPTAVFKGKLRRDKIALQAQNERDAHDEPEPVVFAWVRVHGDDIPPGYRIPLEELVTSTEVTTRVRCGDRAMGYSLFYGVWEFIYEKIVFFF
ncbi:MAG: HlyD family secretion protein [Gemmataceae bacterium]|nr:HlyD family secretion protein [Gemmataceae bacterium]